MSDLEFPNDYDSRPGRRVLINDGLIPYIAGAMAALESSDSWITLEDYSAAYTAIAELYIAMSELETANANTVLAGPASGAAAPAAFRSLVAGDLPGIPASQITSGMIPLAVGGTGADLSDTGGEYFIVQQRSPGEGFYVGPLESAHLPAIDAGDIVSGVLPVARGGTGASAAPAMRAWLAAPQTIAPTTFTKLAASTEYRDTNGNYDPTLYRFTPTAPGTYVFTGYAVYVGPVQNEKGFGLYLYKNGARSLAVENYIVSSGTGDLAVSMIGLLDANGTDYFELFTYHTMTINGSVWQGGGTFAAARIGP